MNSKYLEFLKSKIETAPVSGFSVPEEDINPALKPHQRDAVRWALRGGRRALFESFGLGKTVQELEFCHHAAKHEGRPALIVLPLGVRQEFKRDAVNILGYEEPVYVRTMQEVRENAGVEIMLTNYERVRDGDIDPTYFAATSLDEASVLRSFGSKTYQTFLQKFKGVKYKMVATATPAPNKYKEIIHYAGYLEVMDTGQALTRFFKRDSTKANNLTLYPHREEEFWLWVSSWALFLGKPSDLGYSDEGYELPGLEVRTHVVHDDFGRIADRDGQVKMMNDAATSLTEAAREKRDSIEDRVKEIERIVVEYFANERGEERILQGMVCKESGDNSGETERAQQAELCGKQGEIQSQIEKMEVRKSGKIQGASKEVFDGAQGGNYRQVEEMALREQGQGEGTGKKTETEQVRNDPRRVRENRKNAELLLRDMQEASGDSRGEERGLCRSRSQDRPRERSSLHEMQRNAWDGRGQNSDIGKCNIVSKQIVIWCELNQEQEEICKMLRTNGISVTSLTGTQDADLREQMIDKWRNKETQVFLTKPEMYGQGVNLQQCNRMIFAGISYKFEEFIQSVHREYRFLQTEKVIVDIIYTEAEIPIWEVLQKKWKQHDYMQEQMRDIVKKYGLSGEHMKQELERSIGVERVEIKGENWIAVNNDCCEETAKMSDNSVDLIVTSIPFSNHYEYTPSYNDFGHNEDTEKFFEQMDYLTPNLLRVLKPGRVFCCHVKDRVLFGNATGTGMPTMEPFHAMCIRHYMQHGFAYFGMITVVTDVVRENNQTYRLGWSEQCKDGTKMGVGCPEYILLFRKLPTDRSKAYADERVSKTKDEYTRAQWQIDAHGFWRSSGNRLITKDELLHTDTGKLQALYRKYSRDSVYSYDEHVKLARELDKDGHLPATFMVVAPGSWTDQVWDDINRMRTLNTTQSQRRKENHVCPLQLDIVDRLINRYSNPGDLVLDPFGGLGTVALEAIKAGRCGYTIELNNDYFRDAVGYLKEFDESQQNDNLCLFDVI